MWTSWWWAGFFVVLLCAKNPRTGLRHRLHGALGFAKKSRLDFTEHELGFRKNDAEKVREAPVAAQAEQRANHNRETAFAAPV